MPDGLGLSAGPPDPARVPFSSPRNLGNAALVVAVAIPPFFLARLLGLACDPGASAMCRFGVEHPIAAVQIIFFLTVTVLFWLISIVQKSTWLIDPYWTLIPPMIGHYFFAHPHAVPSVRASLALALTWVWAIRLTYNYFRRERFRFGVREDWRFQEMRRKSPRGFLFSSFFIAYASQQLMLGGLCLSLWAATSDGRALGPFDALATIGSLSGIVIAHVADTDLAAFMRENEARRARGEAPIAILDRGLFRYSRHPNYFGENLHWWSLGLLGVAVGAPWVLAGPLFNTLVMVRVTQMTEARMGERPDRAEAYRAYRARTRSWLPLPKGPIRLG